MPNQTQRTGAILQSRFVLPLSSVSVIIPAYNDETTVPKLVQDADCLLQEICGDYEIIVVNDGSKDNTLSVLHGLAEKFPKLRVINHEVNQGFGRTIRELYYAGRMEYVFSLPGDYQFAPKELIKMAEGLLTHDLVVGWRIHRNDPPRRKFQSGVYNLMLRACYGSSFKDVNSIKLFRRSILNKIELESHTPFVDAELCIRAARNGFRVIEIPIEHLPRLSQGASGGKFSVIFDTFSDLFRMAGRI